MCWNIYWQAKSNKSHLWKFFGHWIVGRAGTAIRLRIVIRVEGWYPAIISTTNKASYWLAAFPSSLAAPIWVVGEEQSDTEAHKGNRNNPDHPISTKQRGEWITCGNSLVINTSPQFSMKAFDGEQQGDAGEDRQLMTQWTDRVNLAGKSGGHLWLQILMKFSTPGCQRIGRDMWKVSQIQATYSVNLQTYHWRKSAAWNTLPCSWYQSHTLHADILPALDKANLQSYICNVHLFRQKRDSKDRSNRKPCRKTLGRCASVIFRPKFSPLTDSQRN